ncbi:MAG: hypothetical protein NT128_03875 [Proteobacteria bacterium]|nr:hypothetical protein [Pseudomonadota bacterium]
MYICALSKLDCLWSIGNVKAVSYVWRLLLAGDDSLVGSNSTIPEIVIATMEQQTTLEALQSCAEAWVRSKLL